jgi:integrase
MFGAHGGNRTCETCRYRTTSHGDALDTAMRRSEIFAVKWRDVDFVVHVLSAPVPLADEVGVENEFLN